MLGYFYMGSEGFSDFIPVSVSEGNQNPGLTLDKRKKKATRFFDRNAFFIGSGNETLSY